MNKYDIKVLKAETLAFACKLVYDDELILLRHYESELEKIRSNYCDVLLYVAHHKKRVKKLKRKADASMKQYLSVIELKK